MAAVSPQRGPTPLWGFFHGKMTMADKPWKVFERKVASLFGTVRNALSGGNSKMTRSDSLHPDLFIECKYQKGAHKVLRHLMDDAAEKAEKEKKIPILAVGFPGRPFNESLIIIRACDVDEVVDPIHLEDKDGRF